MSHPEGDDDEEHLEENAEDHIARESKRHDAQERSSGAEHNGWADLSHGVSNASILRDIRVLLSVGKGDGGKCEGRQDTNLSTRGVRIRAVIMREAASCIHPRFEYRLPMIC